MAARHPADGLLRVGLYGLVSLHALTTQRVLPWAGAVAIGIAAGMLIASLQPIRADKSGTWSAPPAVR